MDFQINRIVISITEQLLNCYDGEKVVKTYFIASAKNGIGQMMGSECTPLGKHRICEKFGGQAVVNSVFVARQFTGEVYSEAMGVDNPHRDWILSRILWLEGLEPGFNQGDSTPKNQQNEPKVANDAPASCDTRQRFIYIHGCPDSHQMQIPSSHGCIKMRNADIIELYEGVSVGTPVYIQQ